jgi:hypothetical protein
MLPAPHMSIPLPGSTALRAAGALEAAFFPAQIGAKTEVSPFTAPVNALACHSMHRAPFLTASR